MNLFRLSIVFIVLCFVIPFILKNALPWAMDSWIVQILLFFSGHENVPAFIAEMAIIFLVNIIAQVWNKPSGLGFWDALWYKFEPSKTNESLLSEIREEHRETDGKLTEYDWDTIVAGTDNFSDSNVVRRGKSGTTTIYKALLLPNGGLAAVKRFSPSSGLGGLNGYMNEIFLLPKLEDPNIIKLIGYCIHGKEKLLVHEYMPFSSSLESLLQQLSVCKDRLKSFPLNQWSVRFKLIIGIAEGVAYLHEYSGLKVVHGDLKLSNILLDYIKMNPKVSGFGSARSSSGLGDMSREHSLKMKSDIYRFGVMVLVMMSGTRVTTDSEIESLIHYAKMVRSTGMVIGMVEDTIMATHVPDEARKCLLVGLLCTHEDPDSRPAMTSVHEILQGDY